MKYTIVFIMALMFGMSALANDNIVIVFDDSGSMTGTMGGSTTKLDAAKSATVALLKNVKEEDSVGLYLLNRGWVVPLQKNGRDSVGKAVMNCSANGGTPLGQSMKDAADVLLKYRDENHYGTYRMIILTDGAASDQKKVDDYITDIMSRGVYVDLVGVKMSSRHSLSTQVTSYREANNPESLKKALVEIMAESPAIQDGNESDYEFLSGVSNEVAVTIISGLESDNQPIGVKKKIGSDNSTFSGLTLALGVVLVLSLFFLIAFAVLRVILN